MRNLCFVVAVFLLSSTLKAQTTQPVFKGRIQVSNTTHFLQYAFHKGDVVVLDVKTEKRKLDFIKFLDQDGNVLGKKESFEELEGFEVQIPETGVYDFQIKGRGLSSRDTRVNISRKPGKSGKELFNPAFVKETVYDTTEVTYACDTVVGNLPAKFEEVELSVFDKYLYETRDFVDESFQLKGNLANDYSRHFNYKVAKEIDGVKMKSFTYTITSKVGGAKHWKLASIGTSVGTMFVNPAAGYALNHMMGMMGPQAGGEPTMVAFSKNESDAAVIKKMADGKNRAKSAVSGLLNTVSGGAVGEKAEDTSGELKGVYQLSNATTHSGQHYGLMEDGTIILTNADPHKAKNVRLNISGIYYAPLYRKVKAKEKIIIPEKQELQKEDYSVEQARYFELLDSNN
ncbi:hypothetical protein [Marinilabilia rubra]|uniref:Uncharacterized protein n=1 Tax=Marinilabilia rubra TaxID=2162893 RepID=A0A2U2BC53_9BACT|nr:hypothetical protein [Marinilabilia rubra]PWE00654.1 hypothetical protein DDZ16_03395 [Marinilabilia rubra]